jgi:hypothetical protein
MVLRNVQLILKKSSKIEKLVKELEQENSTYLKSEKGDKVVFTEKVK